MRDRGRLPDELRERDGLELVEASLLKLKAPELSDLTRGCDAIASCLGHNLSVRGIWLPPWRLVTKSLERLCAAATEHDGERHVRIVLMSSSAVPDPELDEPASLPHRLVDRLLRLLLPPHPDNLRAANHLRRVVGLDHPRLEWCAVRPDGLVDRAELTPYVLTESPTRDAFFDAGRVARLQVAEVMARLVAEDELWSEWQARMPVVYDLASGPGAPDPA